MFVLNYFYFLILTFLLFRYLQTKSKLIRDPLHRRQLLDFNGPELFWTLLFSTGLQMACVLDKFRQTRQSSSREKSLNAIKSIPAATSGF